ncbi:MAG: hypothetical protein KF914_21355 [Rhizobiaceae bacterium]|nr:hypothetical protein [Rhizobiaceae bacterium]
MRLLLLSIALCTMSSGHAAASSFVYVAPPKAGSASSIVVLGAPAPSSIEMAETVVPMPTKAVAAETSPDLVPLAFALPDMRPAPPVEPVVLSASIIAFESPAPPVTFEKVAAISSQSRRAPVPPMVIRGGTVGDGARRIVVPAAEPNAVAGRGTPNEVAARKSGKASEARRSKPTARPEDAAAPPAEAPAPTGPISTPQ